MCDDTDMSEMLFKCYAIATANIVLVVLVVPLLIPLLLLVPVVLAAAVLVLQCYCLRQSASATPVSITLSHLILLINILHTQSYPYTYIQPYRIPWYVGSSEPRGVKRPCLA